MRRDGGFDDDRLLAYTLGLDDDPELLAAAENDAGLSGRLTAMRADVDRIGAQTAAASAPEDAYANLSGERWSGLKEYFEAPVSAAKPRRERRWWRVVAPVTALAVLALVVGIVAVNQDRSSSTTSSAEVALSDSGAAQPGSAEVPSPDTQRSPTGFGTTPNASDDNGAGVVEGADAAPAIALERLADQLDHFAIVVLARARAATGALQRFAVVRIFKGEASSVVELEVDDQPADLGRLHLLMLDPAPDAGYESGSPVPIPSPAASEGGAVLGTPLAVSYTYGGEPTMVREFAAGTNPDMVNLPLR